MKTTGAYASHPHLRWRSLFLMGFQVLNLFVAASARAEEKQHSAPAAVQSPSADMIRAEADNRKIDVDLIKAADARRQFYFEYARHILIIIAIAGLFVWAFPQIQEFTVAFGSESFTGKKAPKEPLPVPPSASALVAPVASQAARLLTENLAPGPAKESIVGRLTETEVYQCAGVTKDTLYVCHRAQKIPRRENYRVEIYLDADAPSILDKVEKVTYVLHPTFSPNEITRNARGDQFRLELVAWGEFMLTAKVFLKGATIGPVELKRYLNF